MSNVRAQMVLYSNFKNDNNNHLIFNFILTFCDSQFRSTDRIHFFVIQSFLFIDVFKEKNKGNPNRFRKSKITLTAMYVIAQCLVSFSRKDRRQRNHSSIESNIHSYSRQQEHKMWRTKEMNVVTSNMSAVCHISNL